MKNKSMRNVLFVNADRMDETRTPFWNSLQSELNKKNLSLFMLSTVDGKGHQFPLYTFSYKNLYHAIQDMDWNKLEKLIPDKERFDEWMAIETTFRIRNKKVMRKLLLLAIYKAYIDIQLIQPVLGLIWNDHFPLCDIYCTILKSFGIPTLILERGLLPGTIMVEEEGTMGRSKLLKNNSTLKNYEISIEKKKIEKYRDYYFSHLPSNYTQEKTISKEMFLSKMNLDSKERLIFFAGGNDLWCGLFPTRRRYSELTSPFYLSNLNALVNTANVVKNMPGVHLFYKPHPRDRLFSRNREKIPSNVFIVEEINIHSILELCDVCVTLTSGSAFDALMHHKPTVLLGKMQLSNRNIFYEISDKNELKTVLNNALKRFEFDTKLENWYNHLTYILNDYLIDFTGNDLTVNSTKDLSAKISEHASMKNFDLKHCSILFELIKDYGFVPLENQKMKIISRLTKYFI